MASKGEVIFFMCVVLAASVAGLFAYLGHNGGKQQLCTEIFSNGVYQNDICYLKYSDGSIKPAKLVIEEGCNAK